MPTLHAIIDPAGATESRDSWRRFRQCCETLGVHWCEHESLATILDDAFVADETGSGVLWDANNAGPCHVKDEPAMRFLLADAGKPSLIVWCTDSMGAMAATQWLKRGATSIVSTEMSDAQCGEELSVAMAWDQSKRSLFRRRDQLFRHLAALTDRQKRVLDLTREGLTASAIARELDFSQRTVELDLAAMREKMNEETTLGVVAASVEATLLSRLLETLPPFEHLV